MHLDQNSNGDFTSEGNITCKPGGTFIGPRNVTFVVSGRYGKSVTRRDDSGYSVNSKGEQFVFHTLPELTSVSPNVGSIEGGTYLKISGNSFDPHEDTTQVKVGGAECKIISIDNEQLICKTPEESAVSDSDAGTRGLKYEMWVSTQGTGDTPANDLNTTAADYRVKTVDSSLVKGFQFGERNGYTAKLSGYLVGPYDGDISFYLASSGFTTLYVSNDTTPENMVRMHKYSSGRTQVGTGSTSHRSKRLAVKKGGLYYFEAHHVQKDSMAEDNRLQVYFWLHNTNYHEPQNKYVRDEIQYYTMQYNRRPETQRITLNNMNSAASIKFTSNGQVARDEFSTEDSTNITENWSTNFDRMLKIQCVYDNSKHYLADDSEDTSYNLPGQHGYHTSQVEPYCGRLSKERGTRVFGRRNKPFDGVKYKWFCFAARGKTYYGQVQLLVQWRDTKNRHRRDWVTVKNVWEPSNEWSHQCVNMDEEPRNKSVTWIASSMKEDSYIKVEYIQLPVRDGTQYYQRDEVTISELPVSIERLAPKVPFEEISVQSVEVEKVEEVENQYDVSISPRTCLSEDFDFPLFGIDGAEIVGLDFDESLYDDEVEKALAKMTAEKEYLRTNPNVTFTSNSWGSGTVTIERTSLGSRAPSGSFDLTFMGKTVTVNDLQLSTTKMETLMQSEFGVAGVQTYYWDQRCWNLRIPLYFDRSTAPGDLPLIKINKTNLVVDSSGWESIGFHANRDGGYHLFWPGGDFFRLKKEVREVEVSVNGFLAICNADDCSFAFNSSVTPELTGISNSLDGDNNVLLTISGSKFSSGINNYEVMVGKTPCIVTAASESEITCQLSPGPAGTYPVEVIVKNKGRAAQPEAGQLTYTVSLQIFSNEPSDGSIGGGTTVNVTGTGFPNTLEEWNGNTVNIGGYPCTILESTYTWFTCITSSGTSKRRRKRETGSITIEFGGETTEGGSYDYDASKTPTLSSISPSSGTPLSGGVLTMTGTAFGAKWGKVTIGGEKCELITWSDTEITCK